MELNFRRISLLLLLLILLITIVPTAFAGDNSTINNSLTDSGQNTSSLSVNSINNLTSDNSNLQQSTISVSNTSNNKVFLNSNNSNSALSTGETDYITMNISSVTVNPGDKVNVKGTITGTYQDTIVSYFESQDVQINVACDGTSISSSLNPIYSLDDANTFNFIIDTTGLSGGSHTYTFTLQGIGGTDLSEVYDFPTDCVVQPGSLDIIVNSSSNTTTGNSLYVSTKGSDENGNGSEKNPYATLSKAISVNENGTGGDIIYVANGTYNLNEITISKDMTIIGDTNVTIDLQGTNRAFYLGSGSKVKLENLTFINGYNSASSGVIYVGRSSLTVNNCKFINCKSDWKGGAIAALDTSGSVLITNSSFINCTAKNQGGALDLETGTFNITHSVFINNTVTSSSGYGGAVYVKTGKKTNCINYCNFLNNTAYSGSSLYNYKYSYTYVACNVNYNYWGTNTVNTTNVNGPTGYKWVILNITSNATSNIDKGATVKVNADFTKYTDGTSNYTLDESMPDLTIYFHAKLGNIDPVSVTTSNGLASSTYTATTNGKETISIKVPNKADEIQFIVGTVYTGIVYVSTEGNNKNNGSFEAPKASLNDNDDGDGAITAATTEGGSGEIILMSGIYKEHGLNISNNLTMSGNGTVIIDGEHLGSIFTISTNNININFANLTFINGNATNGFGGAIHVGDSSNTYSSDVLNIVNCNFENNTAKTFGGAISSTAQLNITNCTFKDNFATTSGAIELCGPTNIINSTFIGNNATGSAYYSYGGAIRAYSNNINITDSTFENNSASSGGAIYDSNAVLNISYSTLFNNTASNAANIYASNNVIADYNWWGTNNFTKINSTNKNVNITNWVILTVTAPDDLYTSEITNLTASLNTYTNGTNTGKLNGTIPTRTINFTSDDTSVFNPETSSITDKVITQLTPSSTPGNVFVTVDNETITLPVSQTVYSWFIGETGYRTLQQAINASTNGTVIVGIPGTYIINKEVFVGQRTIPVFNQTEIIRDITIKSNSSTDPIILKGDGNTRIFSVAKGSSATLINTIFENGFAGYAAAIYNDGNLTIKNCTILNNHATDSTGKGGAVTSWGMLTISDSNFINNTGADIGGAIYTDSIFKYYNISITNTNFINNSAFTGGAIYGGGLGDTLIFNNCTFLNDQASYMGGAIFLSGNHAIINNSLFENCTALKDTDVDMSQVTRDGGAIYASNCNLTMSNSKFLNNVAEWAGAVYLAQNIHTYTTTSTNGTTVEVVVDTYNLTNCEFVNNSAVYNGGAICAGYDTVATGSMDNCTFLNNKAGYNGGAIANYFSNMTVNNSTFVNNNASNYGGAVYNTGLFNEDQIAEFDGNLTLKQNVFRNNHAKEGGAVNSNNTYANMEVTYSVFIDNQADIGNDIIYNGTLINQYNWYGTNTPFTGDNKSNRVYSVKNGSYVSPETWVVMGLKINANSLHPGFTTSLTATLNEFYNKTSNVNNVLVDSIPTRTVLFLGQGSFNPSVNYINGVESSVYTAPSTVGTYSLYATIDNETLSVPMSVEGYKDTTIINDKLNTVVNGTVSVNIVASDDSKINVGTMNLFLNGKAIGSVSVTNGVATFNLTNVAPGNYSVTAFYFGKDPYLDSSKTINLVITNESVIPVHDNVTVSVPAFNGTSGENKTIVVNVTGSDGNPVSNGTVVVNVNGENYTAKVVNGTASVTIALPNDVGTYNVTTTYVDGNYTSSIVSNVTVYNSNVSNVTYVLTAKNLTMVYGTDQNFTGFLLDNNGNPVVGQHIALNLTRLSSGQSKVYWVTTDVNGQYFLNIELVPGTYTGVASYTNSKLNQTFKSSIADIFVNKVNETKSNVVLTADEFNHPFGAGENFTGRLVDSNGKVIIGQHIAVKLSRTINGQSKTYWVTTDSNGEYQLAINLSRGSYKAVCTYSGTSIYQSVSASSNIVVTA